MFCLCLFLCSLPVSLPELCVGIRRMVFLLRVVRQWYAEPRGPMRRFHRGKDAQDARQQQFVYDDGAVVDSSMQHTGMSANGQLGLVDWRVWRMLGVMRRRRRDEGCRLHQYGRYEQRHDGRTVHVDQAGESNCL
jgi:hypothetical protein